VDADGLVWVDVRGDPADCEPADRWANIRVKMEKQHAAYQAIQKQKEALMAAPPLPPPPPPMPPPPMAAPANVQAMQLSPAQLAVFMQAQGLGHLAPASALPPSFPRASTLPSPAIPSSRSPARAKKAKKPKRADSAAVGSAGAASASSSSAAAAASSASSPAAASASAGPLLNLNTCSVWELQQLDGVGPKLANRIVTAREHKWLMKKVRFNDNIIDKRKEQQQQSQSPAAAAQPPQSLCECITPERCSHVRAFKSVKSLSKVDGLGTRMMQKLQALLTV
jgi:DNA uptake protein ComE-like DNA-binding protein